jgi:hypothetical protein
MTTTMGKKMARTVPTDLTLADAPKMVSRLQRRAEKLGAMLGNPAIPAVLIEEQRVLVFNTACDLVSIKARCEDGR